MLHFGDHTISGGVRACQDEAAYRKLSQEITAAFNRADYPEVIRCPDRSFGESTYSLRSLFRDEQRRCLDQIMKATMAERETTYRQLYDRDAPLMRFLASLHMPIPPAFLAAAAFIIDTDLRRAFASDRPDASRVHARMDEAATWNVALDAAGLGYQFQQTIERLARQFEASPDHADAFTALRSAIDLACELPFEVGLWDAQNRYHRMLRQHYPAYLTRATQGDALARDWLANFVALGERQQFRVNEMNMKEITTMTSVDEIIREVVALRRTPRATYRLQINAGFTLYDAAALVGYLDTLGVSDVYISPILRARPGSTHGYDICDHSQINHEIGGQEAFDALAAALSAHGMSLIVDTVPNHMGIGTACNGWWIDVLENGPGSIYADYFDIDWYPLNPDLAGKVLLPILEDQYGTVLEQGKLRLAYEDGAFFLTYWEHQLPVAPRSYRLILDSVLDSAFGSLGAEHEHVLELQSIMTAIGYLPPRMRISPEQVIERNREKQIIKRRLAALYEVSAEVRAGMAAALTSFNGDVAGPQSFDALDRLIDAQAYRLAYWRVATEEINYRRFFDINDLAAIRVELPEVFDATHEVTLRLLAEGKASGLRIDHIDGLFDPAAYLRQLQICYLRRVIAARLHEQNGNKRHANGESVDDTVIEAHLAAWLARQETQSKHHRNRVVWPLYVVVEKILAENEVLPYGWATDGTSGYDFLNVVGGLFVDGTNQAAFDAIYHEFNPTARDFRELENATKKMIMLISLASEINELSYQIERMAERTRRYRDFTLASLTFALREVIACLPVYRTYITGPDQVLPRDVISIEAAVAEAKRRNPRTAESIFDFLCDTLLLRNLAHFREEDRARLVELVMTFQQVTGPVMAKGVEDTAFYVYNRLISLNEVGGHPQRFGTAVESFHTQNARRGECWPHAMLTTSTHDTKRGEDVRARIDVLSEMPDVWREALARWSALNADKKVIVEGAPAPDRNDEYLLYQTLVGAWPITPYDDTAFVQFRERIAAYMHKATKEAKVHTSWINANHEYDAAVRKFIDAMLPDRRDDRFRADIEAFQQRTSYYGRFNSLAQTLLKFTVPGVPDLYQGSELWDLSLVDPDNRRPVDFAARGVALDELRAQIEARGADLRRLARELLDSAHDGRVKLYVIERTLALHRAYTDLFTHGAYLPLRAAGERREHICAFARTLGEQQIIVAVPRLMLRLTEGRAQAPLGAVWANTQLALPEQVPGERFRDRFTGAMLSANGDRDGARIAVADIFRFFPLALLERME